MLKDVSKVLGLKNESVSEGGYFSFQYMVSGGLIKILYVLGILFITIAGIVVIVKGTTMYVGRGANETMLYGAAVVILGNLIWRIFCEIWIIIFSLHETTVSILDELKRIEKR